MFYVWCKVRGVLFANIITVVKEPTDRKALGGKISSSGLTLFSAFNFKGFTVFTSTGRNGKT